MYPFTSALQSQLGMSPFCIYLIQVQIHLVEDHLCPLTVDSLGRDIEREGNIRGWQRFVPDGEQRNTSQSTSVISPNIEVVQ